MIKKHLEKIILLCIILVLVFLLFGCSARMTTGVDEVTQERYVEMMGKGSGSIEYMEDGNPVKATISTKDESLLSRFLDALLLRGAKDSE